MGQVTPFPYRVDTPDGQRGDFFHSSSGGNSLQWLADSVRGGLAITTVFAGASVPSLVHFNPAFLVMLGEDSNGIIRASGVLPLSLDAFSQDEAIWKSLCESHQATGSFVTEIELREDGGGRKTLKLQSEPLRGELGEITHRIARFHDIDEQAKLEEFNMPC